MKNEVLKKIVLSVIIVIFILVILFIGREIAIRFFGFKAPSISKSTHVEAKPVLVDLDEKTTYNHIVTDEYIYFVGTDKVIVSNNNGEQKAEIPIGTSNPVAKSSGKYVIVGDFGGTHIYIIEGTGIKKAIETERKIKNISINSSGYCIAITEGDMHKRDVTVYNEKGEELFVWNSGTMLVMDALIADNNKNIVISSIDAQNGSVKTILNFYNISKTEPISTETLDSELIVSLEAMGNYVYCIGESKTYIYKISGNLKSTIEYTGKTLLSYEINKKGVVMAFLESTMKGKRYNVESYSESGNLLGTFEHDFKAKYLDISNDYIILERNSLISVIDYNGREKKLFDPGVDIEDFCFFGNSRYGAGFTANGAYLIEIK